MFLIKEMPQNDRPRERFLNHGREALSIPELIAVILRTGTTDCSVLDLAKKIYVRYGSIRSITQATVAELTDINGMGVAKAIQLLSALELGKRLQEEAFEPRHPLTNPESVYDYMKTDLEMLAQEMFYALYLDIKGKLIEKRLLFVGSLNSALVHPREVFKHAVRVSAASIIVVHNHPSGDPTPSSSDARLTNTLVENGRLMDIQMVDHIIIGKGEYYSFREHNRLHAGS